MSPDHSAQEARASGPDEELLDLTLGALAVELAPRLVGSALSSRGVATRYEFTLRAADSERLLLSELGELSGTGPRVCLVTDEPRLRTARGDGAARLRADVLLATARAATRPTKRPAIWGVLNATPDSFSDGDPQATVEALVERGLALESQGADVIDIGGESTRPGAAVVDEATEAERVLPLVRELVRRCRRAEVSVDTTKAEIARRALDLGARWINDASGGDGDRAMLETVAAAGAGYVCMHRRGTPRTMQLAPHYDDAVTEICEELRTRLARCTAAGVARERLFADPGLGFGKRLVDNLAVLLHLAQFRSLGVPLFVGASRKAFVGALTGVAVPRDRVAGSVAAAVMAADRGAEALRVHDVRATVEAIAFTHGVRTGGDEVDN